MENKQVAVFGGGCFWCTEAVFKQIKGVNTVTPGYAGGSTKNPSYFQVTDGKTGHAEVIKIVFNPEIIPFRDLLDIFMHTHNPTTLNRQEP
jgi:peptide-methionine (S)-S-oxide reductase